MCAIHSFIEECSVFLSEIDYSISVWGGFNYSC